MDNRMLTSSSSSSSDDEIDIPRLRRRRVMRIRNDPFNEFDDVDFKMRFRLSKECVEEILNLIRHNFEPKSARNMPVTAMNQLLITLRYYATGSFQICTGDHFNVSKPTVCRIVAKVTRCIAMLRPHFIHMPRNANEVIEIQNDFYEISRFPRVLGAIDCTHVRIQSPGGDMGEVYRNRKGWFSINTQGVCDAKLRFMDIVARWPGSVHDSTIWNDSHLRAMLENNEFPDTYLLGDGGYACRKYLLTPLLNPETNGEIAYNNAQIRTRNPIERAFGLMKKRFPCTSIGMRLNIDKILSIIVAVAVLHNIAIEMNEDEPDNDPDIEIPILGDPGRLLENVGNENQVVRTALINTVFNRR